MKRLQLQNEYHKVCINNDDDDGHRDAIVYIFFFYLYQYNSSFIRLHVT